MKGKMGGLLGGGGGGEDAKASGGGGKKAAKISKVRQRWSQKHYLRYYLGSPGLRS